MAVSGKMEGFSAQGINSPALKLILYKRQYKPKKLKMIIYNYKSLFKWRWKIVLTLHAKEWMAEKSITREMIMEAIKKGVTVRQTDGFLASYAYIKVAYKVRDNKYIIKTVFVR